VKQKSRPGGRLHGTTTRRRPGGMPYTMMMATAAVVEGVVVEIT
jgi:hypothetical protein